MRPALIRDRDFRLLWAGSTTSTLGDRVYEVALMWYVLQQTGSALQTGSVPVFGLVAQLTLGLVAGTLADRLPRRRLMIAGDLIRAGIVAVTAVLVHADALPIWYVYLSAFLLSAVGMFYDPASVAVLPELVGEGKLLQANAYLSGAARFVHVVGRGIGGVAVAAFGAVWAVIANAVSYCISALCTVLIRFPTQPAAPKGALAARSILRDTGRGIRFLTRDVTLRALVTVAIAANMGGGLTTGIAPVLVNRQLDGNAAVYGLLLTALSLGEFGGMFLMGVVGQKVALVYSLTFSLVLGGAIYVLVAFTTSWHLAVVLFAAEGVALAIGNLPIRTLLQTSTSRDMRGRVFSGFAAAVNVGSPLATFLGALMAATIGLPVVYVIAGVAVVLAGLWAHQRLPHDAAGAVAPVHAEGKNS